MFCKQFMAIQAKNWTTNIREKQYIRENISVIILSIFIIVSERTQTNQSTTPFYLGIAIAGFSRTLAVWWIEEKQTHQKQLQKIMGVSQLSYIFAWIFYFLINGLIVSFIMTTIMKVFVITDQTSFQPGYNFMHLAIIYFLFAISNIGYVLFLCTFFSKAKTGSQAITFIQLITNFLYFLRFSEDLASNQILVSILSFFPQMSFNMSVAKIAFTSNQFGSSFDFDYQRGIITLLLQIPLYITLSLYLDIVLPNELGTHKHPLFFLGLGYKAKKDQDGLLLEQSNIQLQAQSSAKYEEKVPRSTSPLIKMKNVTKNFGEKKVIDNVSLDFYGGQIFCLLGHNGAGKSTTINILTGLLKATSGQIEILGLKYPNDVDSIRRDIGLCLQYNVLYDNLTIQEHLRFYYRIKHQDSLLIQEQIIKTVHECGLQGQAGKLAKNLSGGNKRKLCLANSLIGGSKIVFLDQPSSGLDPNSRQNIWSILKNISRQSRCIILTTHHLEQAQQLSKRIAIMSKGKLIILGSSNYITEKFSVGYHLVITLNNQNPKAAQICRNIIKSGLSRCIQDRQTAKNTLKFRLPLSEVSYFSKTFRELQEAKIGLFSVYMSNLQDAFVKIGQQQDSYSQGFEQLNEKQIMLNKDSQITEEGSQINQKANQSSKQQLTLPEVNSKYSFISQFKAVLQKKYKTLFRSFSAVVSVIMPTVFVSIGVLVVCVAIKNDKTDPRERYILDQARLFILNYFMTWGFIFNTASYCGNIVLERQKKFKYLSNVSGSRQFPYWAANYAMDLLLFLIPMSFFFIIIYSIGSSGQLVTRFAGYLVFILILFAFSFIGYSYLFSFIFQKSTTAFRFFPFINLIFFYMLPLIPSIINSGGILAQYIMPLLTPFVALNAFFNSKEVLGEQFFDQTREPNKLIVSVIALCIQTLVYGFSVLKLQSMRFSLKKTPNEILHQQQYQQNSIRQQQQHYIVSQINAPIKIKNLTKIYGNGKLAVKNNSFSVCQGQIFGLLGPNGAGKSTSFNIVTAAIPKTSGEVKIFNQQINRGIMNIFQQVGVCPQYNPIYQNLTVRQHLKYFALIKGVQSSKIQSTIDFYKNLLSLQEYMNVNAGVLSGGNKRKMCVAMAMIGNPKVAFFDEPSAGVDPISRRYLWKCLTAATSTCKASMILTTHSMNEAETLCSRIGILIKGQFVCLDTPKKLKEQYGKGYRINVLAEIGHHLQIQNRVKQLFQQALIQKVDTDSQRIVFVIKTQRFSLWKAFALFQNQLNHQKKLKYYEIKQSTLEEVFIHLSRLQPYVQQQLIAQPWQLLCWEWGNNGCHIVT